MLTNTKKFSVEAKCVVDGVEIAGFRAIFDSENPESLSFHPWQIKKEACKEHRKTLRADQAEFEDYVYQIQEDMLAKKNA